MDLQKLFRTKQQQEQDAQDYFKHVFPFGEIHQKTIKDLLDTRIEQGAHIEPNLMYHYLVLKQHYLETPETSPTYPTEFNVLSANELATFQTILTMDLSARSIDDILTLSKRMDGETTETIFEHKPTLIGKNIQLRRFETEDIPRMIEIINIPEVTFLTGSAFTSKDAQKAPTEADLQRYTTWYQSLPSATDRLDLAIVANGIVVGEIVLNEWDEILNICNLRILMDPAHANFGYGSEAIQLLLDYAFGTLGLHRIELDVFDFNPRARHVYEKLGFKHEGTKREAFRYDDIWYDIHYFGYLLKDWQSQ